MSDMAPLVKTYEAEVPAAAANASVSAQIRAEYAGTVTGVTYTPNAAITGADTNSRSVNVVNHGQDGTGTTEAASIDFVNGTNAAAFDETALTLSATAADLTVAAGDIIQVASVAVGTGIADPGGVAYVTISRS